MKVRIASDADFEICLALRHLVFVEEQNVPIELERDAYDATATHFLGEIDGTAQGTARVVYRDDYAKVGRVCVTKAARGTGLGKALMLGVIDHARTQPGVGRVILQAQITALGFYEALGFTAHGGIVMDAGIEHRDMELVLT